MPSKGDNNKTEVIFRVGIPWFPVSRDAAAQPCFLYSCLEYIAGDDHVTCTGIEIFTGVGRVDASPDMKTSGKRPEGGNARTTHIHHARTRTKRPNCFYG